MDLEIPFWIIDETFFYNEIITDIDSRLLAVRFCVDLIKPFDCISKDILMENYSDMAL